MTTFSDRAGACAAGSALLGKVQAAAYSVALGVCGETAANHGARQDLANRVIQDPNNNSGVITSLAWLVASDGSTVASSADSAILARLQAIWDAAASMLNAETVAGLSATGTTSTTVPTAGTAS